MVTVSSGTPGHWQPLFDDDMRNFGSWNLHGGIEYQKYGGTLKLINESLGLDHDYKVIYSGGIGFSY